MTTEDTTPTYLQIGDTIAIGSVLPPRVNNERWIVTEVLPDGSRFRIGQRSMFHTGTLNDPNFVGWIFGEYPNWNPDQRELGHDIGYCPFPGEFQSIRNQPTNHKPYSLYLKEHLAHIAHEFVENPLTDIFQQEYNTVGFSPNNIALTIDQQERFEMASKNVHRMVGGLWQEVELIDPIDPHPATNWFAYLAGVWAKVEHLCHYCSGRGWKRRLLRRMNIGDWRDHFSTDPEGAFFFQDNGTTIDFDEIYQQTTMARAGNLAAWVRALEYAETTKGDEYEIHTPFVLDGIFTIVNYEL